MSELESKKTCIACGHFINKESKFCEKCGTAQETLNCKKCGHQVSISAKFCPHCGAKESATQSPKYEVEQFIWSSYSLQSELCIEENLEKYRQMWLGTYQNQIRVNLQKWLNDGWTQEEQINADRWILKKEYVMNIRTWGQPEKSQYGEITGWTSLLICLVSIVGIPFIPIAIIVGILWRTKVYRPVQFQLTMKREIN